MDTGNSPGRSILPPRYLNCGSSRLTCGGSMGVEGLRTFPESSRTYEGPRTLSTASTLTTQTVPQRYHLPLHSRCLRYRPPSSVGSDPLPYRPTTVPTRTSPHSPVSLGVTPVQSTHLGPRRRFSRRYSWGRFLEPSSWSLTGTSGITCSWKHTPRRRVGVLRWTQPRRRSKG